MIEVGQKVRFDPFDDTKGFGSRSNKGNTVTGTVVYVNRENAWFLAEYLCAKEKVRTSFKFCDIGERVKICG